MHRKICEHCGKEFEAVNIRAKFCSDRCRMAAYQEKHSEEINERRRLVREETRLKAQDEAKTRYKDTMAADDPRVQLVKLKRTQPFSHAYWEMFKRVDQEFYGSKTCVNGISVNSEYFAEGVVMSIEELGKIIITSEES